MHAVLSHTNASDALVSNNPGNVAMDLEHTHVYRRPGVELKHHGHCPKRRSRLVVAYKYAGKIAGTHTFHSAFARQRCSSVPSWP